VVRAWVEQHPEGPARDAALARADEGLRHWPAETRKAPEIWVDALLRGEVHPLWPLIRRVDAEFLNEESFGILFQSPAMATVTHLRVKAWSGEERVLAALFASPYLQAVTNLDLRQFGPGCVRLLLRSTMLPRLRRLFVGAIAEEDALSLAREPAMGGLVTFDASLRDLSSTSAATLLVSPHLQNLRELRLVSLHDAAAAESLALGFPQLRILTLERAELAPSAMRTVFAARFFVDLEELNLSYTRIDETSAAILGRSVGVRLRVLDLSHTGFADAHIMAFTRSSHLDALRELRLDDCMFGGKGVLALVRMPQPTGGRITGFVVAERLSRPVLLELVASPRIIDHPQRDRWRYEADLLDLTLTSSEVRAPIPADTRFTVFRPTPFSPEKGRETTIDAGGHTRVRHLDPEREGISRFGQTKLLVVRALIAETQRVYFFAVQPDGPGIDNDCTSDDQRREDSQLLVKISLEGMTRALSLSPSCFSFERGRRLRMLADRIELLADLHGVPSSDHGAEK